jgi:hypothetical protein
MASRRLTPALLILPLLLPLGCEKSIDRTVDDIPAPTLSLVKAGANMVELRIAGAYALRALQGRLTFDPQAVTVTKVEAGDDAKRLDRVFFSDPQKAAGSLVVGLGDTRRVKLPARGALLRFYLEPAAGKASLALEDPLGAIDEGQRVSLAPTRLEVTLP